MTAPAPKPTETAEPCPSCRAKCEVVYGIKSHPGDKMRHQVQCFLCDYHGPSRYLVEDAIYAHNLLCRPQQSAEPVAGQRPLNLKWGRHDGRGIYHIEWHAPCGCAYHPEPKPHVHPCIKHSEIDPCPEH